MKIEIEVSEDNECTGSPWWIIVDPRQNFKTDPDAVHYIASMITGPFFSREEAERVLQGRRYRFGKGAKVYCHSGADTIQYRQKVRF